VIIVLVYEAFGMAGWHANIEIEDNCIGVCSFWDASDLRCGGVVQDVAFNLERTIKHERERPNLPKGHIIWDRAVVTMEQRDVVAGRHKQVCARLGLHRGKCYEANCKRQHCEPGHEQRRIQAVLRVEMGYYEFPDGQAAAMRKCLTFTEAVKRRLSCQDGMEHSCNVEGCTAKWRLRKGDMVGLPRMLVIGTEDDSVVKEDDSFYTTSDMVLFGKSYTLGAMIFYKGTYKGHYQGSCVSGHYITRFKIGRLWYEYDDMSVDAATKKNGLIDFWGTTTMNSPAQACNGMFPRAWFYVANNGRCEQVSTKGHGFNATYFQSHFHGED
jgi:hypothetical protein